MMMAMVMDCDDGDDCDDCDFDDHKLYQLGRDARQRKMPITAADVEQGYMKTKKKLEERNRQKLKQEKKAKKAAKKKGRHMTYMQYMHIIFTRASKEEVTSCK